MRNLKLGKRILAALVGAATMVTGISGVSNIFAINNVSMTASAASDDTNYAKLLQYSMYFYDANMCGKSVGETSAMAWRDDCHTGDEVDGGFHDAGDHVKFGLPAGYSASTLGWGYYEFKDAYESLGQTAHLRTITDYFATFFKNSTKLDSNGNVTNFCYQIGSGKADHAEWCSPEVQDASSRKAYWTTNGASDIAASYAAALAANYVNFGNEEDLKYAKALYEFSLKYNVVAEDGPIENGEEFYKSFDYYDDQAWAAGWLYLATNDTSYKNFLSTFMNTSNAGSSGLSGCQWGVYSPHSWNNVSLGTAILYAEMTGASGDWSKVNTYLSSKCSNPNTYYCEMMWGSARYNAAMQLAALAAAKHTSSINYNSWCQSQMSMILGKNPINTCFVVGFSDNSAKYAHHRAASGYDSFDDMGQKTTYDSDGHTLVGALVGGPLDSNFTYTDSIQDYTANEVTIDYNAGLVGAAAGLYSVYKTGSVDTGTIEGTRDGGVVTTTPVTTTTEASTTTAAPDTTTVIQTTTQNIPDTTTVIQTTMAPDTTTTQATTTTKGGSTGGYKLDLNQTVVYSQLPENDRMIGWEWSKFGISQGETVTRVDFNISTPKDKIGKWQGAFGTSTSVAPDYWKQTDATSETINGKSGTITWTVDSATASIIQMQYGGELKFGTWWIDCDEFVVDSIVVYTDKNPFGVVTTTAAMTTTTTKTTTTTAAPTTTAIKDTTTAAPTTTATKDTTTAAPTTTENKDTTTTIVPGFFLRGDVNEDGKVTLADLVRLSKAQAGMVQLSEIAQKNADCNADGGVNDQDMTYLAQYLVRIVNKLPD